MQNRVGLYMLPEVPVYFYYCRKIILHHSKQHKIRTFMITMATGNISHPYHPRDLHLPHYRPNENSIIEILTLFFGFMSIALVLTWLFIGRYNVNIQDKLKLCWFVSCGFIHSVLEAYYGVFHKTFPSHQTILAQICKFC